MSKLYVARDKKAGSFNDNTLIILDTNVSSRRSLSDIRAIAPRGKISFIPGLLETKRNFEYTQEEWDLNYRELLSRYPGADGYVNAKGLTINYELSRQLKEEARDTVLRLKQYRALSLEPRYTISQLRSKTLAVKYMNEILDISNNILSFPEFLYLSRLGENKELREALMSVFKSTDDSNLNGLMDTVYLAMLEHIPDSCFITQDRGAHSIFEAMYDYRTVVTKSSSESTTSYSYNMWKIKNPNVKTALFDTLCLRKVLLETQVYEFEYLIPPWEVCVQIARVYQYHSKDGEKSMGDYFQHSKRLVLPEIYAQDPNWHSKTYFSMPLLPNKARLTKDDVCLTPHQAD